MMLVRNDELPTRTLVQVLHGYRQHVSWDAPLNGLTCATPTLCFICHRELGRTHDTMGPTTRREGAIRSQSHQMASQFRLRAATRPHEAGIASNRVSAMARWIRSWILYSPPVTLGKPVVADVSLYCGPKLRSVTRMKSLVQTARCDFWGAILIKKLGYMLENLCIRKLLVLK